LRRAPDLSQVKAGAVLRSSLSSINGANPVKGMEDQMALFGRKPSLSSELANFDAAELERIAHDVGISSGDLQAIAAHENAGADELLMRMADMGLDSAEVAASEPAVLRDLQRTCTLCDAKGQCDQDLLEGYSDLPDYCPNRETLRALAAERQQSEKAN
jgi:hypothetical protein